MFKLIFTLFLLSLCDADYPNYNYIWNPDGNTFPGDLFVHSISQDDPHIGILNHDSSLKWEVFSGNNGMDFKVNNEKLSYFHKPEDYWIIVDSYMNEIDTLQCANNKKTDFHDIKLLDNNGYILQCYDSTWTYLDSASHTPLLLSEILIIQEFNNQDSMIFEWNALDYLSINDYPEFDLSNPVIPFMHGNSIEIDTDNNLIISNRTSDEVLKIDRNTGEIIWTLGGPNNEFTFINDNLNGFNKQHDVRRIQNGNITMFDNGTMHNQMVSRAVEYELDEINKTATLIWEYIHPDSIVSMAMGSVQRLPNNNTLINWGFFFESIPMNAGTIITEVDYEKNLVMNLTYPQGYYAYRVYKYDWDFSINTIKGDTNLDNVINVIDVMYIVNQVLNPSESISLFNRHKTDLNTDGVISVIDIIAVINIIIQ